MRGRERIKSPVLRLSITPQHRIYRRRSTAGSGEKYKAVNIDRLFSDICGIVRKAGTLRVGDPFFDEGYAET
jgi:hypothetical protein